MTCSSVVIPPLEHLLENGAGGYAGIYYATLDCSPYRLASKDDGRVRICTMRWLIASVATTFPSQQRAITQRKLYVDTYRTKLRYRLHSCGNLWIIPVRFRTSPCT